MLDRDMVARYDHPLEQQPDEPLSPLKVQLVQPGSQRRGKGREIRSQPVEPSLVHLLRLDLLAPCVRSLLLGLQPLPPCLELFDRDPTGLEGIDQALDLPLESPRCGLEATEVAPPLRTAFLARSGAGAGLIRFDLFHESAGRRRPRPGAARAANILKIV
ncbi:hypothetical protein WME88_20345 [Sorangium sp. So ce216]